ncbi:snRNA-activating protein complex subunit 3 [Ceratina calcarata]|uniref:snRNA-activating protein complex subunit 3 n=1 Tax=Ceratina calcarata TaxID=156304 RepID=A0AAJ7NF04_9HYME|nr:snRNA-activating protein complex subunit 3 [Ceratina calcarata]
MDDVYKLYDLNASPKVDISGYFNDYLKLLVPSDRFLQMRKDDSNITSLMGVQLEKDEMSMLTDYCSVNQLTVEGECEKVVNTRKMRNKKVFDPKEPEDVDLQTLQNLRKRWSQKTKHAVYKYKSEYFINETKKEETNKLCAIPGQDILVFVRVYHPFMNQVKNTPKKVFGTTLKLNNVIAMLGFQTLAQLRDKISCISDYSISRECSENLKNAVGPMAKDVYKSGFFFIEDTFYNDTRCSTNVDYSRGIIEWAQRKQNLGPFKTDTMENTRIDSLHLRFGYPWVYKHQGGCEHLIVFSDARLINCDDEVTISAYPRIVRIKPSCSKFCMICSTYNVKWITLDHDRIPHNPCYFCDDCFKSYNYVNCKKVGEFKAYAYPQNIEAVRGHIKI